MSHSCSSARRFDGLPASLIQDYGKISRLEPWRKAVGCWKEKVKRLERLEGRKGGIKRSEDQGRSDGGLWRVSTSPNA